ncbi:unnamed protein product, partial [Mycena citricolor]
SKPSPKMTRSAVQSTPRGQAGGTRTRCRDVGFAEHDYALSVRDLFRRVGRVPARAHEMRCTEQRKGLVRSTYHTTWCCCPTPQTVPACG